MKTCTGLRSPDWMKYLNDYLILSTIDLIEMPNLSSTASNH